MKTKTWIFLLALLLILCLGTGIFLLLPRGASDLAEITSQGKVLKTVSLHLDQTFAVELEDGSFNEITVHGGKIAVTAASCPDHYCMERGFCNSGTQIVCLPNRLIIRFLGEQTVDGAVG